MARVVALLRGINVGGKMKLSMADLRGAVASLGYADVQTHLQSGNVVFTTSDEPARAASAIEAALARSRGLHIAVLVRSHHEMADVVARGEPDAASIHPARYVVFFLSAPLDPGRAAALEGVDFAPDTFRIGGREIFASFPAGMGRSRLAAALVDKRLCVTVTARNWNTVTALLRMAGSG